MIWWQGSTFNWSLQKKQEPDWATWWKIVWCDQVMLYQGWELCDLTIINSRVSARGQYCKTSPTMFVCMLAGFFPQPNGNFFVSFWEFFRGSTIFWCRNPKTWNNPSIELALVQHISGRYSCWIPTAYCLLVKKLELFGETSRNNQVKIKWPHIDARHMAHMSHMTPYLTALPLDHVSFTYDLWQWFKPILTQIVSDSVSCGLLLIEDS